MPLPRHSLCWARTSRRTLVLRPPHRPLSVVTTIAPTRFTSSRRARKGGLYSVFALATCMAISNAPSTYGREARIRSWALFILAAETISIALVILRVLCTLLILFRISFEPAISIRAVLLEILDRRGQRF